MGWLKEELQDRGVKAKACYEACKVSQPTWNKIEENPSMLTAKQIQGLATLLKYTPEELLKKILFFNELTEGG
ncbi:helix-turn-helix domain-containing protein [Pedobacter nutrimenti]|uniref:Cro/C1-type helix-turn-helix DNA-binding protein n=1 Tax=Pedobacter nutrimenti TaxID=1241337 RepID=A0A318UK95_9SPHI|nr:helix-turn-helix transcriptional regulator [Pedobacter nutrimenti]PYF68458.1 Cro/C1-type helix-turn-helix DNA-binding protein [Pedobacter nutrimenti]